MNTSSTEVVSQLLTLIKMGYLIYFLREIKCLIGFISIKANLNLKISPKQLVLRLQTDGVLEV